MKKQYLASILLITPVIIIGVAVFATKVKANRSYFVPTVQTAIATTSPDYMRTANATLTLDAYTYAPVALNNATLLVQTTASTSAVQTITINYSQDGIDWFNDALSTTTSASTIPLSGLQRTYTIAPASAGTVRNAINVPTPVRFVRATVSTSTALSSVWMQWVPVREMVQ